MTSDFDIGPVLRGYGSFSAERLRIARSLDELRLSEISRGIVFVFAVWSGPSVMALQRFARVMQSFDTRALELVVLDTDCLTRDSETLLFGTDGFASHGKGEIFWVRDGRVVAKLIGREGSEGLLEQHTKRLLDNLAD